MSATEEVLATLKAAQAELRKIGAEWEEKETSLYSEYREAVNRRKAAYDAAERHGKAIEALEGIEK